MSILVNCICEKNYEIPVSFRGCPLECPNCHSEFVIPRRFTIGKTYQVKKEDAPQKSSPPSDFLERLKAFFSLRNQLHLVSNLWLDLLLGYRALRLYIGVLECQWKQRRLFAVLGAKLICNRPQTYFQSSQEIKEHYTEIETLKKQAKEEDESSKEEKKEGEGVMSSWNLWLTKKALISHMEKIGQICESELEEDKLLEEIKGEKIQIHGEENKYRSGLKILGQGSSLIPLRNRITSWGMALVFLFLFLFLLKILFFIKWIFTFCFFILLVVFLFLLIWPTYTHRRDFAARWQREIDKAIYHCQ